MKIIDIFSVPEIKATTMIVADKPRRGYRTLRLSLPESIYLRFVSDVIFARETLDRLYKESPELFPILFDKGYVFNGLTSSSTKLGYRYPRGLDVYENGQRNMCLTL